MKIITEKTSLHFDERFQVAVVNPVDLATDKKLVVLSTRKSALIRDIVHLRPDQGPFVVTALIVGVMTVI